MDFVEENVNAQCVHCNKYLHGNLGRYAVNLEKKWGGGVAEDMMRRKASAVKYTKDDLDSIYEYTKGRLEELERYDG
jgi:hypothetical protein